MGSYPFLRFWGRHGRLIAMLVGLAVACGSIVAAAFSHLLWLPVGFTGALFVWLLLRSYTELVQVLMEMLLPDPDLDE